MCFLFAETPEPSAVALFFVLTVLLLAAAFVILWKTRSYETKLILLGLLVAVFALGCGTMLADGSKLAQTIMRIGVILVLGGLAVSLLSYLSGPPAEEPSQPGSVVTSPPAAIASPAVDVPADAPVVETSEDPRREV